MALTQYARPFMDVAVGDWVTPPLHTSVAGVEPNDSTFITAGGETYCEIALSPAVQPVAGDVVLRVRYRRVSASPESVLTVRLMQGPVLIAQRSFEVTSTVWTTAAIALNESERANITNWGDLRVRLQQVTSPIVDPNAVTYGAETVMYGVEVVTYG